MPKIRVLPDILASQVAAGEVVERPASVVKELVENSIDAGAREIRVDIDRGGVGLIRVSDDGCGMSREDALLSLERHATSKLRASEDLSAIRTLGFRGEAVPSIASVSQFRMVTREADAIAGTEIVVSGGKVHQVRDAGCAPGTVIEARSLFFNMPARRKFMRAESTEAAHVEHQLRLHALAAPQVRFRLRKDDRDVFDLPPAARSLDRVRQLLGPEQARELKSIPRTHGNGITVEGHLLPANHARKGRKHQFVFLNGRPVEDGVIARALAEGFKGALPDGHYPAAWVWIDIEPERVDVNVHPAKREVRFHRPTEIRDVIIEAVIATLRPARVSIPAPVVPASSIASSPTTSMPTAAVLNRFRAPDPHLPTFEPAQPATTRLEPSTVVTPEPPRSKAPDFRILDLLLGRFVLMESDSGLVVFDPKAARERILYETILNHGHGDPPVQALLVPVLLELDPRDLDLVLRGRSALLDAGLEVAPFGGNTLKIQAVPACLEVGEPRAFLGALMDELMHDTAPGPRFAMERIAKTMAKRSAASLVPRLVETKELLRQLFDCDLPYCAPDGRPILSEYSLSELERRLGIKA